MYLLCYISVFVLFRVFNIFFIGILVNIPSPILSGNYCNVLSVFVWTPGTDKKPQLAVKTNGGSLFNKQINR